ncbi:hypothetical protein K438DRAFT_1752684 [Mycena galopus ATCC 62051]|nr:hypothetical protein K438DRAFT_1752684 [Mycena galopus ATCC 62051]
MASKKKAASRQPASSRNKGTRKQSKKSQKLKENIPLVSKKPTKRRKPKPAYKTATHSNPETGENEATAALVSLAFATPVLSIEQPGGVDEQPQPDDNNHSDTDYNNEERHRSRADGEDNSDDSSASDSSEEKTMSMTAVSEISSKLDDALAQIAPPTICVGIPGTKFEIPFEAPYKNGMRDLKGITSATTFDQFLAAATGKMGTRITGMDNIAYIPSYKPRNPKPIQKILDGNNA